jgi:hypothetical protein
MGEKENPHIRTKPDDDWEKKGYDPPSKPEPLPEGYDPSPQPVVPTPPKPKPGYEPPPPPPPPSETTPTPDEPSDPTSE